MTATEIYRLGYQDLVSVIPPGATLSPQSKIRPEQCGKCPGIRSASGLWRGYHWQDVRPSLALAERIERDGANVGLRAKRFPAIDVDVRDPELADVIAGEIERLLQTGPMRIGQPPKRLYLFRLDGESFGKMALYIESGERHCIEVLGDGQQYLVAGMHPRGAPYKWPVPLVPANEVPLLSCVQASRLLDGLVELCDFAGIRCERANGHHAAHVAVNQQGLKAANLATFAEIVRQIPNTNEAFPAREDYISFGIGLKAATQDDPGLGLELYQEWAAKWPGNHNGPNRPETVAADWERMGAPFAIGADYIHAVARRFGIDTARYEFEALPEPPASPPVETMQYTDDWLVGKVAAHDLIRYVPENEKEPWLCWDGKYWKPSESDAYEVIRLTCREVADHLLREGATVKEQKQNAVRAESMLSAHRFEAVQKVARRDPRIVVPFTALDPDPDLLGTPGGVIDLRTGELLTPDPAWLITRCTSVVPQRGARPLWNAFLAEATGEDRELQRYLQRAIGYCLTGHVYEHVMFFMWGTGGNGKGAFLNTIIAAFGTYQKSASPSAFLQSANDKHPTDLASLIGARMVTAQEVKPGQSWDEERLKSTTGGDPLTARFMHRDPFTFQPEFKLFFAGNHKPHISNFDEAMQRRIHLIPFTQKPSKKILDLKEQLIATELPAILHWGIEGCIAWRHEGLRPPQCVQEMTTEYFHDEDVVGRWLAETCVLGEGEEKATVLYQCWLRWCERNNENAGTQIRFGSILSSRGLKRRKSHGIMVYEGISLLGEFAVPTVE